MRQIALLGIVVLLAIRMPGRAQSPEYVYKDLKDAASETDEEQAEIRRRYELSEVDGILCRPFDAVSRRTLTDSQGERIPVIEVNSTFCGRKFLLLFGFRSREWHYLGTISLNTKYRTPTYKLIQLTLDSKRLPCLVISRNPYGYASGMQEDNLQIYSIGTSSLRLIFSQLEHLYLGVPIGAAGKGGRFYEARQDSTFQFTDSGSPFHPATGINETRVVIADGRKVTLHFTYSWNARWSTFYAGIAPP